VQVKNEECYVLHKSQFNALGKQTTVLKGECSKEDQKNVNQAYAHTQNKYFWQLWCVLLASCMSHYMFLLKLNTVLMCVVTCILVHCQWCKNTHNLAYKGVSKLLDCVTTKYMLTTINTYWEATQRVIVAELTRLVHKKSDTTAPSGRELYHLQFSFQAISS